MSESTKELLVIKVAISPNTSLDSVKAHLDSSVQGKAVTFDDDVLQGMTDMARLKKVYKLNSGNSRTSKPTGGAKAASGMNGTVDQEKERLEMEVAIIGIMALRGAS